MNWSVGNGLRRFGGGDANDLIGGGRGAYVAQGPLVAGRPGEERALVHARSDAADSDLNLAVFDDDELVVCINDIAGCLLTYVESGDVTFKSKEGEGGRVDADDAGTRGRGCGGQTVAVHNGGGKFARDRL